jgi:hypothetical protein
MLWIQIRSDWHNFADPDRERYPGPANPHPDPEPDPDHFNQMKNYRHFFPENLNKLSKMLKNMAPTLWH